MEQQIRFCTTSDGVRIAYATAGEGPPLVLITAWVGHLQFEWSHAETREFYEGLARGRLLVRFDKRGTGLSDRQAEDFSVEARLRGDGPTGEELTKARELSKGRLLLRLEDTRAVSAWVGGQDLLLGTVRNVDQVLEEMEAVTLEDVQRLARELIVPDQLYLAVVGPFRSDKRFTPLLKL